MLIIPEIETVVILTPRTGTGSLYRTVKREYPETMALYRHMEADGVPLGYDRWRRVGVLRHPVSRMWSLFNYLGKIGIEHAKDRPEHDAYHALMRATVEGKSFEEWLLTNQTVFTSAHDKAGALDGGIYPWFSVRHAAPENQKSQYFYLRPDLGVEIVPYTPDGSAIGEVLGIEVPRIHNVVEPGRAPTLSEAGMKHMRRYHGWDLDECRKRGITPRTFNA